MSLAEALLEACGADKPAVIVIDRSKIETITAAMNNTSSLSRLGRIQFEDVDLAPSVSAACLDCKEDTHTYTYTHTKTNAYTNGACLLIMRFLLYRTMSGR